MTRADDVGTASVLDFPLNAAACGCQRSTALWRCFPIPPIGAMIPDARADRARVQRPCESERSPGSVDSRSTPSREADPATRLEKRRRCALHLGRIGHDSSLESRRVGRPSHRLSGETLLVPRAQAIDARPGAPAPRPPPANAGDGGKHAEATEWWRRESNPVKMALDQLVTPQIAGWRRNERRPGRSPRV